MIHIKKYNEALKTSCQTPDANYNIEIGVNAINCQIELPFDLDIDGEEAKILEANIHNAMEMVLAKYFSR